MPMICIAAGCSDQKDDVQGIAARDSIFRGRSSRSKAVKEEVGRFCKTEEG